MLNRLRKTHRKYTVAERALQRALASVYVLEWSLSELQREVATSSLTLASYAQKTNIICCLVANARWLSLSEEIGFQNFVVESYNLFGLLGYVSLVL
jgi:hypothetical protein